jgi:zinc and cadmium transporter
MIALWWIVSASLLMGLISLVGALTLVVSASHFKRLILPLVALSAGSLLGGALFHLQPEAVEMMGEGLAPWIWCAAGFVVFFVIERYLQWRHCQEDHCDHREPKGWLILFADGIHNVVDGLAVGGAFVADIRLGLMSCLVIAVHEIPQELGDFGILMHCGWRPARALLFNFLASLTFLLGGLVAWGITRELDVSYLLAVGAGSFLYIAAADLLPELARERHGGASLLHFLLFVGGIGLMLGARELMPEHSHGGAGHEQHEHDESSDGVPPERAPGEPRDPEHQ